jgi:hypothetical protein
MAKELKRIVKINKTKGEITNILKKSGWYKGENGDYYYLIQTIYDNTGYEIGETTISVYPKNNKILVSVDKMDFPKGNEWQAKVELEQYADFLKEILDE